MSQIIIREAIVDDFEAIKSLLNSASLPSVDIKKHLINFYVLENEENIIGTIGMEFYGDTALLRSFVVKKKCQKKGYGHILYQALISRAMKMNVKNIYLLTETADEFFSKKGFKKLVRELVPHPIKQTNEYSTLCPSDSICMVKRLNEEGR
ncbi:MAG: arsenic resistance N-acetyltransferase ArsN2 [Ignavibacteria bacterium]|nr:arsenic resistance N-acetyltransferase ArsN2 [Ignavibacteria bacterium]